MCNDVRLSMGEELPVMQEVVCGDASSETNPLEDSQAMDCTPPLEVVPMPEETVVPSHSLLAEPSCPSSFSEVPVSEENVVPSHSLLAEASCPSSFSGVPMSEEIAVPSHSLLAEASCPSTSTVVQNDGSIVVTTESIVMVDSPVDKSSAEVSRKRKTDVEISTSSSKMLRVLPRVLQRCPFPECSSSNTKMKRHILYKHLPKCFSEDRKSRNDHEMCIHALDSLSIAILGRTDWNELLNIVSSPGAIPDYSNIHPNLMEKMKGFSNHNSWQIPAEFSLHPINSKALLLHYRCLCCLLLLLSEEETCC